MTFEESAAAVFALFAPIVSAAPFREISTAHIKAKTGLRYCPV